MSHALPSTLAMAALVAEPKWCQPAPAGSATVEHASPLMGERLRQLDEAIADLGETEIRFDQLLTYLRLCHAARVARRPLSP